MAKTLSALSELAFSAAANDNDPTQSDADRIAEYKAAMVEWHARQERARLARLAFNQTYKPLGEPKWSAVKKTYNKAYYDGGFRMVIDGCPIRVAAHVKEWKPRARAMLGRGTAGRQEQQALEQQARLLGLVAP